MAQDKKSIIVYSDWIKKFEALTDDEAGRLIKHFFRYVNDLSPKFPDRITELSFIDIEQCLKRDLKKWEIRAERSRENGKSGGRPKNPVGLLETQEVISKPRKPDSVNVNVNDTVNTYNIVEFQKETSKVEDKIIKTKRVDLFVEYFNQEKKLACGDKGKFTSTSKVVNAFKLRIVKYGSEKLKLTIRNAFNDQKHIDDGFKYVTPEFVLREEIIERYINITEKKQVELFQAP